VKAGDARELVGGVACRLASGQREIDMELDGTSVHLKAGDVLVQRGTIHNWVNNGTVISVPFFVNPDYAATIIPVQREGAGKGEALACGPHIEAAYRVAWPRAGEPAPAATSGM
jgi:hypothetical protein